MRTYSVRRQGNPKQGYPSYGLTVPTKITKQLVDIESLQFTCELTDEGIFFRLVGRVSDTPPKNWRKK